jgi:hypothetical protein
MNRLAKKTGLFIVGFASGCLLLLIPAYAATIWRIPACAEGCPTWMQNVSIVMYLATPFAAGITLAWSTTLRRKVVLLLGMELAILTMFWLAYAQQVGLLRRILVHV